MLSETGDSGDSTGTWGELAGSSGALSGLGVLGLVDALVSLLPAFRRRCCCFGPFLGISGVAEPGVHSRTHTGFCPKTKKKKTRMTNEVFCVMCGR